MYNFFNRFSNYFLKKMLVDFADVAILGKDNDGLHMMDKYHGNEDVKVIVSELYKSGKFNPTDQTFSNKYPKDKYVLQ